MKTVAIPRAPIGSAAERCRHCQLPLLRRGLKFIKRMHECDNNLLWMM
jgi:hypothetical protein